MSPEAPTWEDVLLLYGSAMLEAQRMEEAMIGLLCAREEATALRAFLDERASQPDPDAIERLWASSFKLPAGRLIAALKPTGELPEDLARQVADAIEARNLVAHHYLRDHEDAKDDGNTRAEMAKRLGLCVERFRMVRTAFESERGGALQALGLAVGDTAYWVEVTTPGEARMLRYLDPTKYNEDGDLGSTLPHPFDNSTAPWHKR